MRSIRKYIIPYVALVIASVFSFGCEEDLNYIEEENKDSIAIVNSDSTIVSKPHDTTKIVPVSPILIPTNTIEKANYYVAPDGNDLNPGTLDKPFKTWDKIIDVVKPGDLIYLRGGVYQHSKRNAGTGCYLVGKSGEAGKNIRLWAYPGENPILDCKNMKAISGQGIYLTGNYWHIKGIEVINCKQSINASNVSSVTRGIAIKNASHNIIENVRIHDNEGIGFGMSGASTKNLILNSDFYNNYDKLTVNSSGKTYHGGNADGAHLRADKGSTNTIKGCRFYKNSDDGLDLWQNEGIMIVDSCWAFNNGIDMGDGNGFKLGETNSAKESYSQRLIYHCISFGNKSHGFDQNDANVIMTFYNNIAYQNKGKGYYLAKYNLKMIFANNISFSNVMTDNFTAESVMNNNSWNGFKVTSADFNTVSASELQSPRKENGDLPEISFLTLSSTSSLIDKGKVLSFPYSGAAPDIGPFEAK